MLRKIVNSAERVSLLVVLPEKFKVAVARRSRSAEIVFDDEDWHGRVFRNDNGGARHLL